MNDAYFQGEVVTISARCMDDDQAPLMAMVTRIEGLPTTVFRGALRNTADGLKQIELPPMGAGAYRVQVGSSGMPPSVSDVFIIGGPE